MDFLCRLVLEAQNPNNPIQATEERSVGFVDAALWRRVGDTQLLEIMSERDPETKKINKEIEYD